MYDYKELVVILENNQEVFTLPLYSPTKESSQILIFLLSGTLTTYGVKITRFGFTRAGNVFLPLNKGDFERRINKRKSISSAPRNLQCASRYALFNKETNQEITLEFTFCTKQEQCTLAMLLPNSANDFLVSQEHFIRIANKWEPVGINLPTYIHLNLEQRTE